MVSLMLLQLIKRRMIDACFACRPLLLGIALCRIAAKPMAEIR